MSQKVAKEVSKVFSKTINGPKTSFPMYANSAVREKQFLSKCSSSLYNWQIKSRCPQQYKTWITHDGPPYANGDLHMGHFENKVLKDIVNRHKVLSGYRVEYKPGWDCHGLPIELKALQSITSDDKVIDPIQIRQISRKFASETIKKQKKSIAQWGIISLIYYLDDKDKTGCYYTFTKDYELKELELFKQMMAKNCIYRGLKPVYWSPHSHTALAEAELEYKDNHRSESIYVRFDITHSNNPSLQNLLSHRPLQALVYTTTPWTIPSNICLCINPSMEYSVVECEENHEEAFLILKHQIPYISSLFSKHYHVILDGLLGESIQGSTYTHPLFNTNHVFISGSHVTDDTGTGVVHTAPSHGLDDFNICKYHNVISIPGVDPQMDECNIISSIPRVLIPNGVPRYMLCEDVDEDGNYYPQQWCERLANKNVLTDGNSEVMKMLSENNHLYFCQPIFHRYPSYHITYITHRYDWRAKTPVIFRVTPQWFINTQQLTANNVITTQLKQSTMLPPASLSRLSSMIQSRPDWCISRQRAWGVPIPVIFRHDNDQETMITDETNMDYIISILAQHGTDYWFSDAPEEEFVRPEIRMLDSPNTTYHRCRDTLDVWVDSGASWFYNYPNTVVDLYLEGSDQHRGWFQSSILTSHVVRQQLPFKALVTHGFLVDENGQKMSKSLGNMVTPSQLFDGPAGNSEKSTVKGSRPEVPKNLLAKSWAVDVCRMWVASSDYTSDVSLGVQQLLKVQETYQKIRNTNRYLLSNLYDFDATKDTVSYDKLTLPDKWCLSRLYDVSHDIQQAYDHFIFTDVYRSLTSFASSDLSSTYFDIIKDRLYTDAPCSQHRRASQTVLSEVLSAFPRLMAPIAPFLAEEIYSYIQSDAKKSIFEDGYTKMRQEWDNQYVRDAWNIIMALRSDVNKEIEKLKKSNVIKSGLEIDIGIEIDTERNVKECIDSVSNDDLADCFICSNAYQTSLDGDVLFEKEAEYDTSIEAKCKIQIKKSNYCKCPRCWKYKELEKFKDDLPLVCHRCCDVLKGL